MTELATRKTEGLVHPITGEIVAADAPSESIAEILHGVGEYHRLLGEFERFLNAELLARMDRDATWTQRVGSGALGYQFELRSSSPSAGTEEYPADELQVELDGLVKAGIISTEGADKALRRRLKLELGVPWNADLDGMKAQLDRSGTRVNVCGVECFPMSIEPERKVIAAGVKALRKIPGAIQALDRALRQKPPPSRRVKVTKLGGQ